MYVPFGGLVYVPVKSNSEPCVTEAVAPLGLSNICSHPPLVKSTAEVVVGMGPGRRRALDTAVSVILAQHCAHVRA